MEELERTFLLKSFPEGFERASRKEMLDIYIPSSVEHPHLRIRKSENVYEITNKQPLIEDDSSRQIERTISLTEEEYQELATIQGKRVAKTRFTYKETDIIYDIDVFIGPLAGLVLVDVEFSSQEEMTAFAMPSWCLAEVTQEKFIAGGMLCGKSYEDIKNTLSRFNYTKIESPT